MAPYPVLKRVIKKELKKKNNDGFKFGCLNNQGIFKKTLKFLKT